jgi:glycosyltransferase involved in cell wall biosynthesis
VTTLQVSAVIPTYNRAALLPRAIRSALEALDPGDEVIVADDGSTDDTAGAIRPFGERVRHLRLPHRGAGPARNAGLAAAPGNFVAFLDSDDEWFPDKIALQRVFLERMPEIPYVFSNFAVRMEDGTVRPRFLVEWTYPPRPLTKVFHGSGTPYSRYAPLPDGRDDFPLHVLSMYEEELRNNLIAAFTLMVRREVAAPVMKFSEDLPTAEEWQAFGRLAKLGPGAYFDTETAWQHGHSSHRLSATDRHVLADAWLTTIERVWATDREFVAANPKAVPRARANAQLMRAESFARRGRIRDAGRALRMAGPVPVAARATELVSAVFTGGLPG